MAVAWPKIVKTHNLPRLTWAAKNSRGANFFHLSHFPRYTSFMASQPRKNVRCLAKNSENTQFATFNLGCKTFAPCDFFFIPAILHATRLLRRPSHAKLAVAWAKNSENTQLPTFNLGCKKFAQREFFSSQPFFTLHVFYGVPATKTGR